MLEIVSHKTVLTTWPRQDMQENSLRPTAHLQLRVLNCATEKQWLSLPLGNHPSKSRGSSSHIGGVALHTSVGLSQISVPAHIVIHWFLTLQFDDFKSLYWVT